MSAVSTSIEPGTRNRSLGPRREPSRAAGPACSRLSAPRIPGDAGSRRWHQHRPRRAKPAITERPVAENQWPSSAGTWNAVPAGNSRSEVAWSVALPRNTKPQPSSGDGVRGSPRFLRRDLDFDVRDGAEHREADEQSVPADGAHLTRGDSHEAPLLTVTVSVTVRDRPGALATLAVARRRRQCQIASAPLSSRAGSGSFRPVRASAP